MNATIEKFGFPATLLRWKDLELADQGWPGPPDIKSATQLSTHQISALRDELAKHL